MTGYHCRYSGARYATMYFRSVTRLRKRVGVSQTATHVAERVTAGDVSALRSGGHVEQRSHKGRNGRRSVSSGGRRTRRRTAAGWRSSGRKAVREAGGVHASPRFVIVLEYRLTRALSARVTTCGVVQCDVLRAVPPIEGRGAGADSFCCHRLQSHTAPPSDVCCRRRDRAAPRPTLTTTPFRSINAPWGLDQQNNAVVRCSVDFQSDPSALSHHLLYVRACVRVLCLNVRTQIGQYTMTYIEARRPEPSTRGLAPSLNTSPEGNRWQRKDTKYQLVWIEGNSVPEGLDDITELLDIEGNAQYDINYPEKDDDDEL
ncbi:hypothetical protein EVAR_24165_1 [Eumeta japonica]|uniref:Uncharacterized protein n=1 Tax=Eumeta variegata TaxID=151549 RepID=A0A4C1W603_EUMVA|nr:hypothetical protein EVAR_24165_1 [Eumeta japonica]